MNAKLNFNQQLALNIAKDGHNLLLFGSAGTGKSYVITKIAEGLKMIGKTVALTCSTGVACLVYPEHLQAMTIHRFSGIDDGRFGPGCIGNFVKNSVKHGNILQTIKSTDVLIIDECSMISARTLQCIEEVMSLKDNMKLFGGMQVILCGDFLQLPPVKDISYGDSGLYCFETDFFKTCFPHRITLTEIMRQSELNLITAIRHVSKGANIPEETFIFIKSLERPLPASDEFDLKLFAKNDLVDDLNRKSILDFPGQIFEFLAKDEGEQKYKLGKLTVPKTLWLKIGIPVILLRNLTSRLVNGLRGTVLDIDEEGPTIHFAGIGVTTKLTKYPFEIFSPRLNKNVAVRTQFPIKPAFGLTIHKAQGMTLERLEVDCRHIFQPGQLGVAMSRVKTVDGLRITNFHPRYCMPHQEKVSQFIEEDSLELQNDNSCCRNKDSLESTEIAVKETAINPCSEDTDIIDPEDQFDKDFDEVIKAIDSDAQEVLEFSLPADFSVNNIIESLKTEKPVAPPQFCVNTIISELSILKLELFCKREFIFLSKFMDELNISEPRAVQSKTLADFYKKTHNHLSSFEYRMNCMRVFDHTKEAFTDDHMHICFNSHLAVRKYLMKQKTNLYSTENQNISTRFITVQSKARLRYVAGYCVAKLIFSFSKKKRNHTFSASKDSQVIYEDAIKSLSILNLMKEDEESVKSYTSDETSLADICRRQNVSRSLTHVPDDIFKFFITLCENCLKLLVGENLNKYGEKMFTFCSNELLQNKQMRSGFRQTIFQKMNSPDSDVESVIESDDSKSDYVDKIYQELVKKFLLILFAQFRKDVKSSYHVEKTIAHRKQIQITKEKKKSVAKTTNTSISQTIVREDELPGTSGQQKSTKSNSRKKQGKRDNVETIKKYAGSYLNEDGETIWVCPVCGKEEDAVLPMICCDECDDWFHWACVGISKEPAEDLWYCDDCRTSRPTPPKKKNRGKGKGKGKKM